MSKFITIKGEKTEKVEVEIPEKEFFSSACKFIFDKLNPHGYYNKERGEWGYMEEDDDYGGYLEHVGKHWVCTTTDKEKIKILEEQKKYYEKFEEVYNFLDKKLCE